MAGLGAVEGRASCRTEGSELDIQTFQGKVGKKFSAHQKGIVTLWSICTLKCGGTVRYDMQMALSCRMALKTPNSSEHL
jgi:hypothetical protein